MVPSADSQNSVIVMKFAITFVKILMAIVFGLIAGIAVMLMLPLLFTYALIKIIGGAAAKIN
jgi:hypothetical protein